MSTIKDAIDDLFDARLAVDAAVARHFGPAFRQRVNGTWHDRAAFAAGVARLRETVGAVRVTVLDELADGARYAERHVIELALHGGERLRQEVYLFAERDPDGRFGRMEETTLPLGA